MKRHSSSTDGSSTPDFKRPLDHDKDSSPKRVSVIESKCKSPNK